MTEDTLRSMEGIMLGAAITHDSVMLEDCARRVVPALCAEVRRLREVLAVIRTTHADGCDACLVRDALGAP